MMYDNYFREIRILLPVLEVRDFSKWFRKYRPMINISPKEMITQFKNDRGY